MPAKNIDPQRTRGMCAMGEGLTLDDVLRLLLQFQRDNAEVNAFDGAGKSTHCVMTKRM